MEQRDPGVAAWSALLRAHAALVQDIGRELEQRTALPLSWYDVLLELNAAPGRNLRMSDLGERVVLSRSRVSRVVDELEHAGYVLRAPDPSDGRATRCEITPAGRAIFRKAAPRYLELIDQHFASRLSTAQLEAIRGGLEHLLETTRKPPPERGLPK